MNEQEKKFFDRLVTVNQYALRTGHNDSWVAQQIKKGLVESFKIGGDGAIVILLPE